MLEIRTYRNYLITDSDKNEYCFKSSTNQIITPEQLAREFKEYNASFTEADALGMMNIQDKIVRKFVALGYTVRLPFCQLYDRAVGTTDGIKNSFQPGAGDNKFIVVAEVTADAAADMTKDVAYKLMPPDTVTAPRLLEMYVLTSDAQESRELVVNAAASMRLRGNYIKANLADKAQGVFFVAEDKTQTRVDKYTRNGSNVIDFAVPDGLAPGIYSIVVVTRTEGGTYMESKCTAAVTVA